MPRFSLNWLFLLAPLVLVLNQMNNISPVLVFLLAALAIIPIAKLLVEATEQIALRTGDAVGGLLNATFGNAPELIIAIVALKSGYIDMVKASIIGAILVNLLFAQGLSLLMGGLRFHNQEYNSTSTRTYSTMMMIAVISMSIPGAFGSLAGASTTASTTATLGLIVALVLLATYGLYLFFMLKTHPELFKSQDNSDKEEPKWSIVRSGITLVLASVMAAILSEVLVGATEGTGEALGMTQTFLGLFCLAVVGGVAEVASAVSMARKNRLDLAISISLGSSIQIALFVAPALVLISYFIGPVPLQLSFGTHGLVFLLLSVLIASMVSGDGKSNWFKGSQLLVVYFMLAVMVYLLPG